MRCFWLIAAILWITTSSSGAVAQWQLSILHPSTSISANFRASFDSWFTSFTGLMRFGTSTDGFDKFRRQMVLGLPAECLQQVIFYTYVQPQRVRSRQWVARFQRDPTLNQLPICFSWIRALKPPLRRHSNSTQVATVTGHAQPVQKKVKFTHRAQRAFVHADTMQLGLHHSYAVFVHELAHFAGFVDEYNMREDRYLPHSQCRLTRAPNLRVVKQNSTGPTVPVPEGWYDSEQCQQYSNLRFLKPENGITFMTYFDSPFIPLKYIKLWRRALAEQRKGT